ncbi:hypothetical protein LPJ59_005896, partial [Coemansia sp. RSA 2399]
MRLKKDTRILKVPVQALGWAPEHRPKLAELAETVHYLRKHTYGLIKFIFLNEMSEDPEFNLSYYTSQPFYKHAFLLANGKTSKPVKSKDQPTTYESHELINKHLQQYILLSGLVQPRALYMGNQAAYVAIKIDTAYKVMIKTTLGNRLRGTVNALCNTRNRSSAIRADMSKRKPKPTEEQIKQAIRDQVTRPAAIVKEQINRGAIEQDELDEKTYAMVQGLEAVLCGVKGMVPKDTGLWYDIKVDPLKYAHLFFRICQFAEEHTKLKYRCFPLCTSWVPAHVHIDLATLANWFLGGIKRGQPLTPALWDSVIDTNCRAITSIQGGRTFWGSILTDGVSACVLKQADSNSAGKEQVDDDDNNELCDDQNDDDELLGIEPASTT